MIIFRIAKAVRPGDVVWHPDGFEMKVERIDPYQGQLRFVGIGSKDSEEHQFCVDPTDMVQMQNGGRL